MKKGLVALLTLLASTLFLTQTISAQETTQKGKVNWLTWEQAMELSKKEKRKLVLDVYTDWCKWCERMEEVTFSEPGIAKYLNENFYPVKFNAEQKQSLWYKDQEYKFVKSGPKGYHELAAELLKGKLSYPSVVFLDENQELIQAIPGFRSPEEFEQIITYFAKNSYKNTPWSAYSKSYKPFLISNKH
ncbi:MAG: thioredoxin family protein [Saprospiraceae bacterium]